MGKWKHKITLRRDNRTGICANCGEVKLNVQGFCMIKNNETSRIGKYRRKYGIDILTTKKKPCELCGGTTNVAYDHCHKTGKFRGWLCMKCNTALGLVNDDTELLWRMIKYLSR